MKMVRIVSRETIKPSSPTPSDLKIYNLPLLDQVTPHAYIPIIFFYGGYKNSQELKKSLSDSLTKYYPFAGRFPGSTKTYIDCNDEGVLFIEAHCNRKLDDFLDKEEQDETLDQLFPDGLVWLNLKSSHSTSPIALQLNHFACGGLAIAVSLSHKVGDVCTLAEFMNHWATVTRCVSIDHEDVVCIKPRFLSCPRTNDILPESPLNIGENCVTRKFVFPNSKLNELKDKVIAMARESGVAVEKPTRVEVLSSLLHRCAVAAAATTAGYFKPSGLCVVVNMRQKMVEKLPKTTVGNIFSVIFVPTGNANELMIDSVVAGVKKGKKKLEGVVDVQEATEIYTSQLSTFGNGAEKNGAFDNFYFSSSLCGFPLYKTDFGQGKPTRVTLRIECAHKNSFFLMDTPDEDGIEALVILEKEEMEIFRNNEELLASC